MYVLEKCKPIENNEEPKTVIEVLASARIRLEMSRAHCENYTEILEI